MSATEASTFDELRTEGLPPAEGLKMANRYPEGEQNPVFSNLVTGDADIVGLVAYSIYKQNKHDWLVAFHRAKGRDPQDSELAAYIIGESTPRRLTTYRHLAEATLEGRGPSTATASEIAKPGQYALAARHTPATAGVTATNRGALGLAGLAIVTVLGLYLAARYGYVKP